MYKLNWLYSLFLGLVACFYSEAQNETNNWYFGKHAALSFSSSPPTVLYNSNMSALQGCSSISDTAGNLMFYSNGDTIWNKNHMIMANGTGLFGNLGSTQSVLIVKLPGSNSTYYVFTTNPTGTSIGLRYSIVDMTLTSGTGSVTAKNNLVYTPCSHKLIAARHCNGKDVWIISHESNSNGFRAYLLSKNGLSLTPVLSYVGTAFSQTFHGSGQLKVSTNGKKIGTISSSNTINIGWVEVFDFDNTNGLISNALKLGDFGNGYGCEFSPDGSKLFASISGSTQLIQWDLCAGSNSAIVNSKYTVNTGSVYPTNAIFGMQLAKDGKIYFSYGATNNIGIIHNPNNLGAAMGLSLSALSVAPNLVMQGLPNFVNNYNAVQMPLAFSSSLACSSVSFYASSQPSQTVAATCTTMAYPTTNHLWNFGDPNSASANTSSLANPVHQYSATGIYTVSLILNSQCRTDTLIQTINVTSLSPTFSVSGPSVICKGETATFSASAAYNYSWTNGSQTSSMAVSPNASSNYSVTATAGNGCKWTQSILLTVNKCLGNQSNEFDLNEPFIYPNPNEGEFIIESVESGQVALYNTLGDKIYEFKLQKGINEMNLKSLSKGVYLAEVFTSKKHSVHKIIIKLNE